MAESSLTIEEVIKIVLGIMGIVILIYLCVSLVGIFMQKTALEQAKANLDEISEKINSLEEGKTAQQLVIIRRGWAIFTETGKEICACPAGEWSDLKYRIEWSTEAECDSKKICINQEGNLSFWVQSHERGDSRGSLPFSKRQGFVIIDDSVKEIKILKTSEGAEIWTADSLYGIDLEKKYLEGETNNEIIAESKAEIEKIAQITLHPTKDYTISDFTLKLSSGAEITERQIVSLLEKRIYLDLSHGCDLILSSVYLKRTILRDKRVSIGTNALDIEDLENGEYYVKVECIKSGLNNKIVQTKTSSNFLIF